MMTSSVRDGFSFVSMISSACTTALILRGQLLSIRLLFKTVRNLKTTWLSETCQLLSLYDFRGVAFIAADPQLDGAKELNDIPLNSTFEASEKFVSLSSTIPRQLDCIFTQQLRRWLLQFSRHKQQGAMQKWFDDCVPGSTCLRLFQKFRRPANRYRGYPNQG